MQDTVPLTEVAHTAGPRTEPSEVKRHRSKHRTYPKGNKSSHLIQVLTPIFADLPLCPMHFRMFRVFTAGIKFFSAFPYLQFSFTKLVRTGEEHRDSPAPQPGQFCGGSWWPGHSTVSICLARHSPSLQF